MKERSRLVLSSTLTGFCAAALIAIGAADALGTPARSSRSTGCLPVVIDEGDNFHKSVYGLHLHGATCANARRVVLALDHAVQSGSLPITFFGPAPRGGVPRVFAGYSCVWERLGSDIATGRCSRGRPSFIYDFHDRKGY